MAFENRLFHSIDHFLIRCIQTIAYNANAIAVPVYGGKPNQLNKTPIRIPPPIFIGRNIANPTLNFAMLLSANNQPNGMNPIII
jgi:hypothetical protein